MTPTRNSRWSYPVNLAVAGAHSGDQYQPPPIGDGELGGRDLTIGDGHACVASKQIEWPLERHHRLIVRALPVRGVRTRQSDSV